MDPLSPREISVPQLKTRVVTPPSREDALEKQRALEEYEALVEKDQALDSILKEAEQARRDFEQQVEGIESQNADIEARNDRLKHRKTRIYLLSGIFMALAAASFLLRATLMGEW